MRRKWLMAGVGIGICTVMFFVSGYPAKANTPGFDAYKTALKNTKALASFTANADLAITDNGTKLFGAQAIAKMNHKLNTASVAAVFNDQTEAHSMNVYRDEGKAIIKSSETEVYKVAEHHHTKWKQDGPPKAVAHVIDAVVGDLWEHAKMNVEADGGKQVTLHVTGDEIPAAIRAVGALAIAKAGDNSQWEHMPKLTKNGTVKEINLDAKISPDDRLERQTAEIIVSGTDASGENHEIAIRLLAVLSGYNQTLPDPIDLTGKQVETMKAEKPMHGWKGHGWHH